MRNGIDQPYTGLTEDQVNDLNLKLYDLINSLEYKVDAPDLHNACLLYTSDAADD